jgi:MoxR-like ATPase
MADHEEINLRLGAAMASLAAAQKSLRQVIIGQDNVIDQALTAILSGGHALLTGVPGLGKTLLTETLGLVLGLSTRRIQFTPDLMPADILGSEILADQNFKFLPGPVFTELLMADEINRASPRTQSALLQAMAEGSVAVAGHNRPLPQPFHVLATQNPLEQEGTYPLPEAQLDRFLLDIRITYPTEAAERAMILATTGTTPPPPQAALHKTQLLDIQALVRAMPTGQKILDAILHLVRGARPETAAWPELRTQLAWGPGPRAGQALMLTARARALLDGRLAPSLDDIIALAPAALRHRMSLSFAAQTSGVTLDDIIKRLTERL